MKKKTPEILQCCLGCMHKVKVCVRQTFNRLFIRLSCFLYTYFLAYRHLSFNCICNVIKLTVFVMWLCLWTDCVCEVTFCEVPFLGSDFVKWLCLLSVCVCEVTVLCSLCCEFYYVCEVSMWGPRCVCECEVIMFVKWSCKVTSKYWWILIIRPMGFSSINFSRGWG